MKILIAGDSHGRMDSLRHLQSQVMAQIPECTTCIQVGDFGFYPLTLDVKQDRFPMTTYAIDGNHEDHIWLRKVTDQKKKDWKDRLNLTYIDRGQVLELGGATIGFLGGAMNVDRPNTGSIRMCYNNYVSDKDVQTAVSNFNKYKLDLIVTHSCPTGIGVNIRGMECFLPGVEHFITKPFSLPPTPIDDCGEHALTELWHCLSNKPTTWVFGHFHRTHRSMVRNTEFVCVGSSDTTTDNAQILPFIYDTDSKNISIGDKVQHLNRLKNERYWQ